MDIVTLAQVVTSVTNFLFVIVLAAGYYFTWRVSQTTLEEMRAQERHSRYRQIQRPHR